MRKVARDRKLKTPKKYLAGLRGSARKKRASLLKRMAKLYKSGATIPLSMFKARVK